jgi:hypothetical protein
MAVFQWVGGYTGHDGINSGYSGNYGGSTKKVWTSVWNGLTTDRGDFSFAPYHWDFVQNWRERVTSSGQLAAAGQPYDYIPATRLPRGGDKVIFGAPWVNTAAVADLFTGGRTEVDRRALGISCLFGGCSGNDRKWPGASDPASTGDIEVVVTDDYGWSHLSQSTVNIIRPERVEYTNQLIGVGFTPHLVGTLPYTGSMFKRLGIGEIGFDSSKITGNAQAFIGIDFSLTGFGKVETINYIAPLHLRFSSFNNRGRRSKARIRQCSATPATSTATLDGWESFVRVMSNNTNSPLAGETANDSSLLVCGQVGSVVQDQGFFGSLDYTGGVHLTVDTVYSTENIYGMSLGNSVSVGTSVFCQPKGSFVPISINCPVADLTTNHDTDQRVGYRGREDGVNRPNRLIYRIGSLTGTSVGLQSWTVEPLGPTTQNRFGEKTPKVEMNSFSCDNFKGWGGYLKTSDSANQGTYPVFRDGYLKRDIFLDLNKDGDPNFRNALIGYSPSDEGLRMDSKNARVAFNLGDNVKTFGSGDPNSTT